MAAVWAVAALDDAAEAGEPPAMPGASGPSATTTLASAGLPAFGSGGNGTTTAIGSPSARATPIASDSAPGMCQTCVVG